MPRFDLKTEAEAQALATRIADASLQVCNYHLVSQHRKSAASAAIASCSLLPSWDCCLAIRACSLTAAVGWDMLMGTARGVEDTGMGLENKCRRGAGGGEGKGGG